MASKARAFFERHLAKLRQIAEERGAHFADVLAEVVETPNQLAKMLDALRKPEERVETLTKRYREQYFEWLANIAIEGASRDFEASAARRRGGQARAKQRQDKSMTACQKIIETEARLIAEGHREWGLNKAIARALDLNPEYVRKVRDTWRTMKKAGPS